MSNQGPIGIFDSGVGGLSVMHEMRLLLPREDFLYYADSAYCPYGVKPPETIRDRCFKITDFLLSRGAKVIVVASNTSSIVGLDAMRQKYQTPIIGVEPGVKPASSITRNGRVGVLATGVTISGNRFSSLLERFGNGVQVFSQPCPGLVELVEGGKLEGPEATDLVWTYLQPLLAEDVDTIVLGCTHYPFLRSIIEGMIEGEIKIVETGEAVARQVCRVLEQLSFENSDGSPGQEQFFTSGDPDLLTPVMRKLWGNDALVSRLVEI
ncbi:MAG: glutamate racemase [Bacillota bacterium]